MYVEVSDNSKTITQPLDNNHSLLIYVGKFTSQVSSCGSSMEDDEGMDSSLRLFYGPLKIEFQLHEKSERCKLPTRVRKVAVKFEVKS